MVKHALVTRTERDQDGLWIYLTPGYSVDGVKARVVAERQAKLKSNAR
jgi:hypothetical protein